MMTAPDMLLHTVFCENVVPNFSVPLICYLFLHTPLYSTIFLPHLLCRYVYVLMASTGGGTSVSDEYVVQTPVSCPTGISPPHNVTVSDPNSISLAWTPPGE